MLNVVCTTATVGTDEELDLPPTRTTRGHLLVCHPTREGLLYTTVFILHVTPCFRDFYFSEADIGMISMFTVQPK